MRPALIFLSYRRDDTGPYALALRSELEIRLDGVPIFLDLNRIQGGNLWAKVLDDALAKATVLIALIGQNWVGEMKDGHSRIESADDWVRKEVARALQHPSDGVLPVLVNCPQLPNPARLPEDLQKLFEIQAISIRTESWNTDVAHLCEVLETRFSVRVKKLGELLPQPDKLTAKEDPLSDEELEDATQKGWLNGWDVEIVHDASKTGYVRESLRKIFTCSSDIEAFEFANSLKGLTTELDHHPRLEIMYTSVTIRLSTFDAGYRITELDRIMASRIDRIFSRLHHSA